MRSTNEKSDPLGQEAWERFSRDWVGLAKSAQAVPQFYGGNTEHRFILLEDLGDVHISLVDALTGTDKNAAEAALQRYATALGLLHGFAHRHVDKYHKIFTKFNHKASVYHDDYESMLCKLSPVFDKLNIIIN